ETINYPSDLKKLPEEKLPQLCAEIRQFIINQLAENPGHFASSLGVVELTVALHYVFNTPEDRIVWDVGHQAYAHKILTGRREVFHSNRKLGGIGGFPNPAESPYDSFISGHASNSISVALGMSVASLQKGENRQCIAVIGDGSMTGGLAFEGISNAANCRNNMLIVLNDNDIAIDPLSSGLRHRFLNLNTSRAYNRVRYKTYLFLKKRGIITDKNKGFIIKLNNSLKGFLTKQNSNIFESLNIRYFGLVDGHDIFQLIKTLREIKDFEGPKVLHIKTVKGKGYKPAEELPTEWHAPGRFNKETGERLIAEKENEPPLYQDVFGKTLVELAEKNRKIMGITPAMPSGSSLCRMMQAMPDRAFDVGIAEGHAVTFAAGLAKEGLVPFCTIYSSFLQRAYDNVIHDCAILNLNVVICIDRAGIVGADGATHQGAFDMAAFRSIPNLTICAPVNEIELRNMMYSAQLPDRGTVLIRYPRGKGVTADWQQPMQELERGKAQQLKAGTDIAVLSIGTIGNTVAQAIEIAGQQGVSAAHYDMRFVKPLDEMLLREVGEKFDRILTVEDGVTAGGFGSAVLEFLTGIGSKAKVECVGIPDKFIEHGTPDELYKMMGLDKKGIAERIVARV
ncbi:MAG: 1-deoxy-D-xylulose-5-phosphate synthase, partial [Prevotellaceae bacterium]|nr:1-deoxy-D-xylulose-5-phosphate synthase [Prevotellaceae bacterium]